MKETPSHEAESSSSLLALGQRIAHLEALLDEKEKRLAELCENKTHLNAIIAHAPDIIMRFDTEGHHLFINRAIEGVVPLSARDYIGKTHRELGFSEAICQFWQKNLKELFEKGEPMEGEAPYRSPSGKRILNWRLIPEYDACSKVRSALCMARDITEHRRAEKAYAQLFNTMPSGFAVHEILENALGAPVDYRFISVNPAFERLTGLKAEKILGKTVLEVLPETEKEWIQRYGSLKPGSPPIHFSSYSGALGKYFEVTAYASGSGQFATLFQDVTERKQGEKEKAKLETLLNQAQKMNAIGRLAGGVAHDFNNKLGVIMGYAEFALDNTEPSLPLHGDLEEILKAARSAKALTQQLLAFARKSEHHPKPIDVNKTLDTMLSMLKRLIGENIELSWHPGENLWPVCMDPNQMDQILTNLCINARDAISGTGTITIETQNTFLGSPYCAEDPELSPGDYIQITITDNGCGMDAETRYQIFEPFFSTKQEGEGTGLGLPTAYGIVKQNAGLIRVYSEPGLGSTFTIYLPRYQEEAPLCHLENQAREIPKGREILLLVEDDPALLSLNTTMLERLGYTVRTASLPQEALALMKNSKECLDLLITDVVMPGMNGPELARQLQAMQPSLRCLFISGYTQNMIMEEGLSPDSSNFLQKPFSFKTLALKVREILEQK